MLSEKQMRSFGVAGVGMERRWVERTDKKVKLLTCHFLLRGAKLFWYCEAIP
jgi:hypothetical protein